MKVPFQFAAGCSLPLYSMLLRPTITFVLFFLYACNDLPTQVQTSLELAGENRGELEKVIAHYTKTREDRKLNAAYYLIRHLPGQYHFAGEGVDESRRYFRKMDSIVRSGRVINYELVWDSLQKQLHSGSFKQIVKVDDIKTIKGEFLIHNIEDAFKAWEYPWAKQLDFDAFCQYILPYKIKNEEPEDWRCYFTDRYSWIPDSIKNKPDAREVIKLINGDLGSWFYLSRLNLPFDISFNDILLLRSGKCPQEVRLATYAMRAMGVPVTMEQVPLWANRNSGHDWNAFVENGKLIAFLGSEVNPGEYKLEFPHPGSYHSTRPKIFRRVYETQNNSLVFNVSDPEDIPSLLKEERMIDVTEQYVPVSTITVSIDKENTNNQVAYLAVFNNLEWQPVSWARLQGNKAVFKKMGRDILYMPVLYEEGSIDIAGSPFLLKKDGNKELIKPDFKKKVSFTIDKKYPAGIKNFISPGTIYELLFWNKDHWSTLKTQKAFNKILKFDNVPDQALFRLHIQNGNTQERIFTVSNGKINWW